MQNRRVDWIVRVGWWITISIWPLLAQDSNTNPPNSVPVTQGAPYSLSQIESINAINGSVSLAIPMGKLPTGPGGFSAGVNLLYSSAIFDVQNIPITTANTAKFVLIPSLHGGGWKYGDKYMLWAEPRADLAYSSVFCAAGANSPTEIGAWFRNYIQAPDGTNHVLSLVGALDINGNALSMAGWTQDPSNAFAYHDFSGAFNQDCSGPTPAFAGTLIFITSDSTSIRVEANTHLMTWIAYLPDGSQASGPIITSTVGYPYATDSPASLMKDRNSNTVTITNTCPIASPCMETFRDAQSRQVVINHGADSGGLFADTITSPGVNGTVQTQVSWSQTNIPPIYQPGQTTTYYCQVTLGGVVRTDAGSWCDLGIIQGYDVTSVQLPPAQTNGNAASLTFGYGTGSGSFGELNSLSMYVGPSGATCPASCQQKWFTNYSYRWEAAQNIYTAPGIGVNPITSKVFTYTELRDGNSPVQIPDTTVYSISYPSSAYASLPSGPLPTPNQITNPDGGVTKIYLENLCPNTFLSRDYCATVPYKTLNPDGSTTETAWTWNANPPGGIPSPGVAVFNPFAQYTVLTPAGASVSRGTYISHDQNGNVTSLSEYDWAGSVPRNAYGVITGMSCPQSGPCPLRTTTTTYNTQTAYWTHGAPAFLRAPQVATTGSAVTNYAYDQPLTTANVTQVQHCDVSSTGFCVASHATYASNGNVLTQTDPNGNQTQIAYSLTGCPNVYPSTIVVATGFPEQRTTNYNYDCNSGAKLNETDDNAVSTTYQYDNIGRQTLALQQHGSLSRTMTTSYDDLNSLVTTTQDDTASQQLTSTTYLDALGRPRYVVDGAGNKVQKAYRYGTGVSYELSSNPYVATNDPTMGWSLTTRDPAGRVKSVQSFAGSNPPVPWGSNASYTGFTSTTYDVTAAGCSGVATQFMDEAGNTHTNCPDGLGRLVAVTEPSGTITSYNYDLLNNLTGVSVAGQANNTCSVAGVGQMRCFTYNWLGRLVSGTNPESGTTTYVYDNNGNVTQQADARGTVIAMGYDHLNRLQSKNYTAGANTAATATVTYGYDVDFKGALSLTSTTGSNTSYTHDGFGRVATSTQTTTVGSQTTPYTFAYGYSMTDQLTQITYPSGRVLSYALDAADRVTAVKNVNAGTNYATLSYTAPGGISTMTTGNNVAQTLTWNDRAQPTNLQVTSGVNNLLTLGFYPCASQATSCSSGNNGNLRSQTIAVPGLSLTQSYTYDNLNRLTAAAENGSPGWAQNYGYDVNGNRWVSTNTSLPALSLETPTSASWYTGSTIPNRINTWTYDQAGNVAGVPASGGSTVRASCASSIQPGTAMLRTACHDSENRMVSVTDVNGVTSTYAYDGSGLRISKTSGGNTTVYVYDAFGYLAAEYSSQAPTSACDTNTCYPILDHLGSTRMLTDANGSSTVTRYDYLPFGQELLASTNGRTTGMGYLGSPDGSNPKFTGKNRDNESGFDWFEVRHMSGAQGRFQSVDPGNAGAYPEDPQTWNAYSYVGNNPLTYTDPSGMSFWSTLWDGTVWIGEHLLPTLATLGTNQIFGGGWWGIGTGGSNSGPWSEQIPNLGGGSVNTGGVFGSGSAGPFVFDYNSYEHIRMTLSAGGDLWFALGVAGVDAWHGSQGTDPGHASWHAMGGQVMNRTLHSWSKPTYHAESVCGAYAGAVSALGGATQRALAGDRSAAEQAVHTIQDSYAGGHQYQLWPGGIPSWSHEKADATYSSNPVEATRRYLQALGGNGPMGSPGSYLYPAPAGCR